jgi:hypothetical protein
VQAVTWIKQLLEYLGGARDLPPAGVPVSPRSLLWGLWWGFLVCLIVLFSGQTTKFIYIDF